MTPLKSKQDQKPTLLGLIKDQNPWVEEDVNAAHSLAEGLYKTRSVTEDMALGYLDLLGKGDSECRLFYAQMLFSAHPSRETAAFLRTVGDGNDLYKDQFLNQMSSYRKFSASQKVSEKLKAFVETQKDITKRYKEALGMEAKTSVLHKVAAAFTF